MNISEINQQTKTPQTSKSNKSNGSSSIQEQFLTMFTASLMHQDPTAPLDASQMTAQLAQISSLEQQEAMNNQLKVLGASVEKIGNMGSMAMVGKDATVAISEFELDARKQSTISGTILVDDSKDTYDYKIDIKDQSGVVVATVPTSVRDGEITYDWNTLDKNGKELNSAQYKLEIYYEDLNGNKIVDKQAIATTTAVIDSMSFWPSSSMGMSNGANIQNAVVLSIFSK